MSQDTIAREAARWWLDGHDGTRDENAFNQWCQADPRHAAQVPAPAALWQAGAAAQPAAASAARQRRTCAKPALRCCCCVRLGLYTRHAAPPAAQVLRTAAGEIREEVLPDGSHVLLSPGSEVHVRIDAQRRQLQLQRGQAWFKVAADARRPFQVHTTHGTVTALGTAFDLAVQGNSSVVTVTEHRVRVAAAPAAGHRRAAAALRWTVRLPPSRPAALAWRERRLHWVSALGRGHPGPGPLAWRPHLDHRRAPAPAAGHPARQCRRRSQQPRPAGHAAAVRVLRLGAGVQVWLPPRREHRDAP
jgi:transmembrane sensor